MVSGPLHDFGTEDEDNATVSTVVVRRSFGFLPLLVAALALTGLGFLILRPGADLAAPVTTSPPEVSSPTEVPAPTTTLESAAPDLSTSTTEPAIPRAALTNPPFVEPDVPLFAVLSSPIGSAPRLFSWQPGGSVGFDDLPALRFWDFNADGDRLAGLRRDGPVLPEEYEVFVGAVGEDVEPLVTGVSSYAWHDTDPDRLAVLFPGDGTTAVLTEFVIDGEDQVPSFAPVDGESMLVPDVGTLDRWGDWGFALRHDLSFFRTTLVRPDGEIVLETDGLLSGLIRLPGQSSDALLLTDFEVAPLAIDPVTGEGVPVPFLDDGDRVAMLSRSPVDEDRFAIQLTRNGFGGLSGGRLLIVDDGEAILEVPAPAPTPLGWDASGEFVVFASQGASLETPRLVILAPDAPPDAQLGEVLTPSSFGAGALWLSAVTAR